MISDAELVKRVIDGEKQAFNELFRRHEKHLFEHFRQAVENSYFSRRHELKRAFLEESTFEDVWNDEKFLSLIDKEVQKNV